MQMKERHEGVMILAPHDSRPDRQKMALAPPDEATRAGAIHLCATCARDFTLPVSFDPEHSS